MKCKMKRTILGAAVCTLLCLIALSGASDGAVVDVYLKAESLTKIMPDLNAVPMWGFADCGTDSTFTTCGAATVPGPALSAMEGDTLNIHIMNSLTGPYTEAISVVIPGQIAQMAPVMFTDGQGRQRVRSFTSETPVSGTTTYTWPAIKAGTYLYQSGSHPAVQVQMGLYGMLKVSPATPGQAYNNVSTAYDSEIALLFSAIDPVIHGHISSGTYGTPPPAGITSTVDYDPQYFLINGNPYSGASLPIPAGNVGEKVLVRFLNAGLETYVPIIKGLYMQIIAEDGNLIPYPMEQYSLMLPAGKTVDALITPLRGGSYPVYDRRFNMTNAAAPGGGMLAYLSVAGALNNRIGVKRSSDWFLDANGNGILDACLTDSCLTFGLAGDLPLLGAWTGTGGNIGVFRNGGWFLDTDGNGVWGGCLADACYTFGTAGDIPVVGSWTGGGVSGIGVFRNGAWYLDINGNGAWNGCTTDGCFNFGAASDKPVAGDWTGNGTGKIGVFRSGKWYLDSNGNGSWNGCLIDTCYTFGLAGDIPVAGDWSGDGKSKIGVFRDGMWYLDMNGNGVWNGCAVDGCFSYGTTGDLPFAGKR